VQLVLKKKGLIRVVLPDVKKIVDNYRNADEFCREFYGYDKDSRKWTNIFIRGHQWMYDTKSMAALLKEVGFGKVKIEQYRKGACPDIESLDLENYQKLSLFIEAKV